MQHRAQKLYNHQVLASSLISFSWKNIEILAINEKAPYWRHIVWHGI